MTPNAVRADELRATPAGAAYRLRNHAKHLCDQAGGRAFSSGKKKAARPLAALLSWQRAA
jgi:hypothetical protein